MPDTLTVPVANQNPREEDAEKLERFKADLIIDADATVSQRDKAGEDMRFVHEPGGMWDGFLEKLTERRSKMQFNITSPHIRRFVGEYNLNPIGVEYKPEDDATTDNDAKNLMGFRNADYRQFDGQLSQDNAVDEVATCGYGCYMLATEFEDETDPANENQRIVYRPIFEAYNAVLWDSSSKWPNKKDARWVTRLTEFSREAFKEIWPDAEPVSVYSPVTRRFNNYDSNRAINDAVNVATRYEIVREKVKVFVYRNLESEEIEAYEKDDHEEIQRLKVDKFKQFIRERTVIKQSVHKTVFSGETILQKTERIPGRYLPIIAMYGFRGYVDGIEWYKGLVRDLKDPQRAFNTQISQLVEDAMSSGQEKAILDPEQVLGKIADTWADLNNQPYVLVKALRNKEGDVTHAGPLGYLKPAQLDQATAELVRIIPAFIQEMTGSVQQDTLDPNASGKAINAMIKRENLNTQDIRNNIANSVEWEGTVYSSMSEEVYATERTLRTLGKDGAEGVIRLNTLTFDEKTGKLKVINSLKNRKFRAFADTGPQHDTEREQIVEEMKGLIDSLSQTEAGARYTPVVMSTLLKNISGAGMDALQKVVRRDAILQGWEEPETDEEKQLLQNAQLQAGQQDPQQQLLEAAAQQAESEARERDSKVLDNTASAFKKQAETQKIISDTEINKIKTADEIRRNNQKQLLDFQKQLFDTAQELPL